MPSDRPEHPDSQQDRVHHNPNAVDALDGYQPGHVPDWLWRHLHIVDRREDETNHWKPVAVPAEEVL